MRQLPCPDCGAPMWEGGRCPWDRGSGCTGRSLASEPRRRPVRPTIPRVAPMPAPKAREAARPREPRLPAGEALRRKRARSDAYNKAHRPTVKAMCVQCGVTIEVHHGGPRRRYCSDRCRGRYERAQRAA